MSAVRSFIVRIYRRRGSHGLSGTIEPVGGPAGDARPPPRAFANDAELLGLMHAGPPPPPRRGRKPGGAGP